MRDLGHEYETEFEKFKEFYENYLNQRPSFAVGINKDYSNYKILQFELGITTFFVTFLTDLRDFNEEEPEYLDQRFEANRKRSRTDVRNSKGGSAHSGGNPLAQFPPQ